MNRALLISIGAAIILIALGVWIYLMLFGTPKSTAEVFTNLGFEPSSQGTTITPPAEDSAPIETLVDTTTGELRQLTTRAVAGYIATTTATGPTVRYVERGTGHVYDIALVTGAESIISRTTVPQVAEAFFSPDGSTVALLTYSADGNQVFAGTIINNALNGASLEPGADNLALINNHTIRYTIAENGVTVGYQQDLTAGTRQELFRFGFLDLDVSWGPALSDIYIATKPADNLLGYLYTIDGTKVTPLTPGMTGLSAFIAPDRQVLSYMNGDNPASAVRTANTITNLPILTLKEKCVFDTGSASHLWCGAPLEVPASFTSDWYKGIVTSNDYLWLVNTDTQSAELSLAPEREVGRSLDIVHPVMDAAGTALFFTNKTDGTLWMYDLDE